MLRLMYSAVILVIATMFISFKTLPSETVANEQLFSLSAIDFSLHPEESKYIAISASEDKEVSALQLTITWNEEEITILDIIPNYLPLGEDCIHIDEGFISIAWHDDTPITLEEGQSLFQIFAESISNTNISEVITINSSISEAVLYDENEVPHQLQLSFQEEERFEIVLHQNKPNPFIGSTLVEFEVPEEMEITFYLLNARGEVQFKKNETFPQGSNTFVIEDNMINQSGVSYLRMEAAEFSETKTIFKLQ